MDWYYAEEGKQVGPITEKEIDLLYQTGKIAPDTLIWHEGMADWGPYNEVKPAVEQPQQIAPAQTKAYGDAFCAECGNIFSKDSMIPHDDLWVCVNCKPTFLQKIKEGVKLTGDFDYGGFWIRFGAKLLDGVTLWIIHFLLISLIGFLISIGDSIAGLLIIQLFQITVYAAYDIFFLGKYSATPGKMICKLKVIRSDGSNITYWRACGRHFAEMLSAFILCIGYIMAGFDIEKRTLHDRICDTRVIKQ